MPPKVKKNILLVEGTDDLFVTANIWEKHGKGKTKDHIQIEDMKGIDELLKDLKGYFVETDLRNLGILVDADNNLSKRWNDLSKILTVEGYITQPKPDLDGTILNHPDPDKPRVGIWIMPDNGLHGMLEDFLIHLVPNPVTDKLWQLSQKCVDEAIFLEPTMSIPRTKARVHTYLAWKKESGVPLGSAIAYSYLDAHKPEAVKYLAWLTKLFP